MESASKSEKSGREAEKQRRSDGFNSSSGAGERLDKTARFGGGNDGRAAAAHRRVRRLKPRMRKRVSVAENQ